MEIFWNWLIELSRFSAVAGCLYFILFDRSWKSISGILFFILFASLFADNFIYFFIRLIYPNSYYIGNSWVILNYILSALLFIKILKNHQKLILVLLAIFLCGALISIFFFSPFSESNTFINVFSNICLIYLSLVTYFELLKKPSQKLIHQPIFWINTAFFTYNSILLLVSVFNNYLIFELEISADAYAMVSVINLTANLFKNIILFYALVLIDKGKLKSTQELAL